MHGSLRLQLCIKRFQLLLESGVLHRLNVSRLLRAPLKLGALLIELNFGLELTLLYEQLSSDCLIIGLDGWLHRTAMIRSSQVVFLICRLSWLVHSAVPIYDV